VVYLVVGGVAAGAGWLALNNAHQREVGKLDLLLTHAKADAKAAKVRADSLEKVYRVDTLRLTKIKRVTDSLTVTVESWKHDTVKVVEYVAKADTAIRACVQALGTCEQWVGAERAGRLAAESQAKILRQQMPSKLAPWRDRLIGLGLGYGLGRLTAP
jgi:hypothetical protein